MGRRTFTDVHVRAVHFMPDASNVSVYCDGKLVFSGITALTAAIAEVNG